MPIELTIINGRILGAGGADTVRVRATPGPDADLVILDRDLLDAEVSAIIGTGVRLTVIGGRIVHRSEG